MVCDSGSAAAAAAAQDEPLFSLEKGNMLCMGCRPSGRCRFGMRLHPVGDGSVAGTAFFPADQEGAGGVVHGGSLMGALDEASGAVVIAHGALAVTAEMSVRFSRPVPIERQLAVRSWPESRDKKGHWIIHAEISMPGDDRALCGTRARFVERDPNRHYGQFQQWLAKKDHQARLA